jgi:hypothetical protein
LGPIYQLFAGLAMTRAALLSALTLGIFLPSSSARADIPILPQDLPDGRTPYSIEVTYDPDKDVSFLYVGRRALGTVQAGEKQSLWEPGRTQSVVAAVSLSLGLASVLLLRGRRGAQIACGLVAAIGIGAIGVEALGNAPAPKPPPSANPQPSPTTLAGRRPHFALTKFQGETVVEVVEGEQIRLVIGTKPKPPRVFNRPIDDSPNSPFQLK